MVVPPTAASAQGPGQGQARRRVAPPPVPPVPPFHTGDIVAPVMLQRPGAHAANRHAHSSFPGSAGGLVAPSRSPLSSAVPTPAPTQPPLPLSFSSDAPPNGSTPGSSASAFFDSFFRPLALYRQLDLRSGSGSGAGAGAGGAGGRGGALFLSRSLRYDAMERSAARRDARLLAAAERARAARSAARHKHRQSKLHAATGSSTAAAMASASMAESEADPYISPADLLGLKLALLSAAHAPAPAPLSGPGLLPQSQPPEGSDLAPREHDGDEDVDGSSRPRASAAAPSLASVCFDRHRVSKRLRLRLQHVLFHSLGAGGVHGTAGATTGSGPGSASSNAPISDGSATGGGGGGGAQARSAAAALAASAPASSSSANEASATRTSPPLLSALQYQHMHAAAPPALLVAAHLCCAVPTGPNGNGGGAGAGGDSLAVEALLSARMERERLSGGSAATGRRGIEFVGTGPSSSSPSSSPTSSPSKKGSSAAGSGAAGSAARSAPLPPMGEEASQSSPSRIRSGNEADGASCADFLFSTVNFFTHPGAVRLARLDPGRDSTRQVVAGTQESCPWSVHILLTPCASAVGASATAGAAAAATVGANPGASDAGKHRNRGLRAHASSASNNVRASDSLRRSIADLVAEAPWPVAAPSVRTVTESKPVQGKSSSSSSAVAAAAPTPGAHATATAPTAGPSRDALAPCAVPSLSHAAPGSFLIVVPLMRRIGTGAGAGRTTGGATLAGGGGSSTGRGRGRGGEGGDARRWAWIGEGETVEANIMALAPSVATAPLSDSTSAPVASVAAGGAASSSDSTSSSFSPELVVVGRASLRLGWLYAQHASVEPMRRWPVRTGIPRTLNTGPPAPASAPTPVPAVASAAAVPELPIMLAWRYVYPCPPPTPDPATSSATAAAAAAAATAATAAAAEPPANKYFLVPQAQAPPKPDVTASKVQHSACQIEYRVNFSCAFCSLRGGDGSSSTLAPAPAVPLRSFTHLVRHLDATHSAYLSFQYGLPRRVQMGPPGPHASLVPVPAGGGTGATTSTSTEVAAESSLKEEQHHQQAHPNELWAYEIVVKPRDSCASLVSFIKRKQASGAAGAQEVVLEELEGLPAPFVEGVRQAVAATPAGPAPAFFPSSSLSSSSQAQVQAQARSLLPPHIATPPQAPFAFFGQRYAPASAVPSARRSGPTSVAGMDAKAKGSKSLHISYAAQQKRLFGPSSGSGVDDTHADLAHLAPGSSSSSAGVEAIAQAAVSFARGKQQQHQQKQKASHVHPHPPRTRPRRQPPGTGALSVAAAASLTGNTALYTRQWYHASSGAPLALCELAYDSDASVDEEWLVRSSLEQIDEFEDVSAGEAAFMKVWNEFVLRRSAAGTGSGSGSNTGGAPLPPPAPIYADYMFPSVCASFARTCAPLLVPPATAGSGSSSSRPNLRAAFLCHLLSAWEFGLLSFPDIEACMRVLDSAAAAAHGEGKLGLMGDTGTGASNGHGHGFASVHAPARGPPWSSARDAAGGLTVRQRFSAPVHPSNNSNNGSSHGAGTHNSSRNESGGAAHPTPRSLQGSPPPPGHARGGSPLGLPPASYPPRSARLRERERDQALATARETKRQRLDVSAAATASSASARSDPRAKSKRSSQSQSGSGSRSRSQVRSSPTAMDTDSSGIDSDDSDACSPTCSTDGEGEGSHSEHEEAQHSDGHSDHHHDDDHDRHVHGDNAGEERGTTATAAASPSPDGDAGECERKAAPASHSALAAATSTRRLHHTSSNGKPHAHPATGGGDDGPASATRKHPSVSTAATAAAASSSSKGSPRLDVKKMSSPSKRAALKRRHDGHDDEGTAAAAATGL